MYWQLTICLLLTWWLVIMLEREGKELKSDEDSNWRSIVAVAKINALCKLIRHRYKNKGLYAQHFGRAKRSGGLASNFPILSDSDNMEGFVQPNSPIDNETFRKEYLNQFVGLPKSEPMLIGIDPADGFLTGTCDVRKNEPIMSGKAVGGCS